MTFKDKQLGSLTKRAEFLFVREGRYRAQGGIVVQMRKTPNSENTDPDTIRVGFTATKKIGNAVTRNRAKRRLRQIAQQLLPKFGLAGYDYVFIARDSTVKRNWDSLLQDTEKALKTLSK
ncbi:MAG: ribonuclease P protein component [Litorimonas sp.]